MAPGRPSVRRVFSVLWLRLSHGCFSILRGIADCPDVNCRIFYDLSSHLWASFCYPGRTAMMLWASSRKPSPQTNSCLQCLTRGPRFSESMILSDPEASMQFRLGASSLCLLFLHAFPGQFEATVVAENFDDKKFTTCSRWRPELRIYWVRVLMVWSHTNFMALYICMIYRQDRAFFCLITAIRVFLPD